MTALIAVGERAAGRGHVWKGHTHASTARGSDNSNVSLMLKRHISRSKSVALQLKEIQVESSAICRVKLATTNETTMKVTLNIIKKKKKTFFSFSSE